MRNGLDRLGGRRRRLERLESRRMMAADLLGYDSGKDRVELRVVPDQIAVQWDFGASSVEDAIDSLPGFVDPVRQGGTEVFVLETPREVAVGPSPRAELMTSLSQQSRFTVFEDVNRGSQMVITDQIIVALADASAADAFWAANPQVSVIGPVAGTTDQFVVRLDGGDVDGSIAGLMAKDDSVSFATLDAIGVLNDDPSVRWAAPNAYQTWQRNAIPNDPRFANQWHLENTGQGGGVVDADVDIDAAWDVNAGGSAAIVVGVVDDGVATDHPDILNFNPGEIPGDGIDNDGNGWVDDVAGWNFVANNNQSSYTAADPHGTAVAGVAAARGNNGLGVAGAAYNSSVLSARIFDSDSVASDAGIAEAIYYMAGRTRDGLSTWRSADVVNHSWGGGSSSAAITEAFAWATLNGRQGDGVVNLVATGNEFGDVSFPATLSLQNEGVIGVGATNNLGERSNYSNFGPALDFVAPSNDTRFGYLAIDTTDIPGNLGYAGGDYTGTGSAGFGGTSSATPLATGIAALALDELANANVTLSPGEIRRWMSNNTDLIGGVYDVETGRNEEMGFGRINAASLLESVGRSEISVVGANGELFDNGDALSFGIADVGVQSDGKVRIRNQGTSPLDISSITASGDFSVAAIATPVVLGVGEALVVEVGFVPTAAGVRDGVLTILSNDNLQPTTRINLRGTGVIAAISGRVYEDLDGDGVRDAGDSPLAGRRVYIDADNDGQFDESSLRFGNSADVAINDFATVGSNVVVPAGVTAQSIQIDVDIVHTYTGDLTITLISPGGDEITLADRLGGAGQDYAGTVFSDDAASSINNALPPFIGTFRPDTPLADLIVGGGSIAGTWRLEVTDNAGGDVGTLLDWGVRLIDNELSATTSAGGLYAFRSVPVGNHVVRVMPDADLTATSAESTTVTLNDPNETVDNIDFGFGVNDRFYAAVFSDVDGDGVQDAGDDGRAGEVVYVDVNNDGQFDAGLSEIFFDAPAGGAIIDNQTTTATITTEGIVATPGVNLIVEVDVTHTYLGDLTIRLVNPDGDTAVLFDRRGSSGNNLTETVFDDNSSVPLSTGAAPFTGSFQPAEPIANLLGGNLNGDWTLSISDGAFGDVGQLNDWQLWFIADGDIGTVTDDDGRFAIDVPSSGSTVAVIEPADAGFTLPVGGLQNVTLTGGPIYADGFGVVAPTPPAAVIDRHIFYHNAGSSDFDSAGDASSAIDPIKAALLPDELSAGQTSGFEHYSTYIHGLNGIAIDVDHLPATTTASDIAGQLRFAVHDGIDAAGFTPLASATPPTVELVPIDGDTTRIKIVFEDGQIANTWLQTTLVASPLTGLAADDVFYFGSVVGDTGIGNSSTRIRVNAFDAAITRANQSLAAGSAGLDNVYDINRDGRVNAFDTVLVRANQNLPGAVAPLTASSIDAVMSLLSDE